MKDENFTHYYCGNCAHYWALGKTCNLTARTEEPETKACKKYGIKQAPPKIIWKNVDGYLRIDRWEE